LNNVFFNLLTVLCRVLLLTWLLLMTLVLNLIHYSFIENNKINLFWVHSFPLSDTDLYSHFLTYEFLHKSSLQSMGAAVTTPLLPKPAQPSSVLVARLHSPGSFNSSFSSNYGRGHSRGGWRHNSNQHSSDSGSDCYGLNGSSTSDQKQGNWQYNKRHNDTQ